MEELECIYIGEGLSKFLTQGKWYKVSCYGGDTYILTNDIGQYRRYKISYFLTREAYRDKVINELLE